MNQQTYLEEIYNLYDKAESRIKESELLGRQVAVPAINELRYAGRHLAEAVIGHDPEANLPKAKDHALRAMYEATEMAVIYLLEQIEQFRDDFRKTIVSEVIGDYHAILVKVDEIREFISRNGSREQRAAAAIEIHQHFQMLNDLYKRLDVARDDINLKIAKENRNKFWIIATFIMMVMIGGITITLMVRSPRDKQPQQDSLPTVEQSAEHG